MGRDKEAPLDMLQARNMAALLSRVNYLLGKYGREEKLSSGYRPSHLNKTIGGAKMSTHTVCAGIDFFKQDLGLFLIKNQEILVECDLYLEHPDYTKTWTHLDTKQRKNRVFIPY